MTAAPAHDHAATEPGSDLVALAQEATAAAESLLADAIIDIRARVTVDGRPVNSMLDREQRAAHGLAWLATYVQVHAPARRLCGARARRRPPRRDRGADRPDRPGRVFRPDSRRHPDEPGRDRAPARPRARRRQGGGARDAGFGGGGRRRQLGDEPRPPGRAHARAACGDGRRLPARRDARADPRGDAPLRRQRGRAARACVAPDQQPTSRSTPSPIWASSACSGSPCPRSTAAWGSARNRCASSPRSCRAAISASARSARAPRSPPSSSSAAAPRSRSANGSRGSPPARCCRPRSSPSPIPAPTSPRCAPAPPVRATPTRSMATRPGSPIRCAPT